MAIPRVNLIPAAYYLRKKVKTATAIAVFLLLAEAVALMAYAFYQKGVVERLTNEQTIAQNAVDNINNIKTEAQTLRDSVSDVSGKVTFANDAIRNNAEWARVYETLARYTYGQVQVTSMNLAPGAKSMTMRIKAKNQSDLNRYWTNLLRCPIVVAALPSTLVGAGGASASSNMNAAMPGYGAGGPPMPGGVPMPGGMPMPGALPGPMVNPGSPSVIASPALEGLAGQAQQLVDALGSGGAAPLDLSRFMPRFTSPFTYDVDMTVELDKGVTIPTYGGGAAAAGDATATEGVATIPAPGGPTT